MSGINADLYGNMGKIDRDAHNFSGSESPQTRDKSRTVPRFRVGVTSVDCTRCDLRLS
jgi:hypothetical protein